jgi:hypothetical protein
MPDYLELRARVEATSPGLYRVFLSGPAGDASGVLQLPFADYEVENFVLRLSRGRSRVRRAASPETTLVRDFGSRLFQALFQGRLHAVYLASRSEANSARMGLRLSLDLTQVPELLNVPWEYLYDDPYFLSQSIWTPIVRYLDLPRSRRPVRVTLPLRILGMVSSPTDAIGLDTEREKANLESALQELMRDGRVEVEWVEDARLSVLLKVLQRAEAQSRPFHVFHYCGHGGYDSEKDEGFLLLEDELGRSDRVDGGRLATILHDTSLSLAVLNACEGGRNSSRDPFSGVACSLVEQEIPAVVAMQFEITDEAAIIFAENFYGALADGLPIDGAMAQSRKAIFADKNDVEWGTPVLFMRVSDGRIFDVQRVSVPPSPLAQAGSSPPTVIREDPAVRLSLVPAAISVRPGDEVSCEVRLKAQGMPASEFGLAVPGQAGEHGAVEPSTLRLDPGGSATANIRFRPARSPNTRPGRTPFVVLATSLEDPSVSAAAEGVLDIGTFADLAAELVPPTSQGRFGGKHSLRLVNGGNVPLSTNVSVTGASKELEVTVDPPILVAPPGAESRADVRVHAGRRAWLGSVRTHPFELSADTDILAPRIAKGEYRQVAIFPGWAPRAIMVVLPLVVLLLVVIFEFAPQDRRLTKPRALPHPINGVKVIGNQLVDSANHPLHLHGVNRMGTEYACVQGWGIFPPGPTVTAHDNEAVLDAMVAWNVNAVRVPMNEDCWFDSKPGFSLNARYTGLPYRNAIIDWVNQIVDRGMVAILDLEWSAPKNLLANLEPPLPMADRDNSPRFWTEVASQFKSKPNVMFSLFGAPNTDADKHLSDPWAVWLSGGTLTILGSDSKTISYESAGMQELVDAIRLVGAPNPIMLGGLSQAQDLSQLRAHLPRDPLNQLIASFHSYPGQPCAYADAVCMQDHIGAAMEGMPLIVDELGMAGCVSSGLDGFLSFLDHYGAGASYIAREWTTTNDEHDPAHAKCGDQKFDLTESDASPTPTLVGAIILRHYTHE